MVRANVDFPAPFDPTTAEMQPGSNFRPMPAITIALP